MLRGYLYILFLLIPVSLLAQDSLTVLFAGDAMMHQAQIDNTKDGNAFDLNGYFVSVECEIQAADVAVVNFEVTLGGKPYTGYPAFSAPDELAVALRKAGFDLFLLANNHCLDRGGRGLTRTLHVLDSLDIKCLGTYPDADQRKRSYPFLLRKNGFRLIMLNYTYETNGIRVNAPRIVNYIDKQVMAADIAEAKLFNPDFIIANMHWGIEYKQHPSQEQRDLADWLTRQGVDLVIGNHPHVVQPMEIKQNEAGVASNLIVYSLGNFISNMSQVNTNGGVLLKVVLGRKGLKRYISSAQYALVFSDRYQNTRRKDDLRVVPAVTWRERSKRDSLPENSKLNQYIENTRTLLNNNNIGVKEYFFE